MGLLVAVILAGCSGGGGPSPSDTSRSSLVDDAAARAAVIAGIKRDYSEWIPNPPDVTPVRWVRPEELQELHDACMGTQGFPKNPDGSMDTPPERMEAYHLALYTCSMRYPVLPKYAQPLGDAQKRAAYAYTVEYLVPCLKANGFDLRTPVPSEASFVDTWGTGKAFTPYEEVFNSPGLTNQVQQRVERACPQQPPSAILWDGMTVAQWAAAHPIQPNSTPSGS